MLPNTMNGKIDMNNTFVAGAHLTAALSLYSRSGNAGRTRAGAEEAKPAPPWQAPNLKDTRTAKNEITLAAHKNQLRSTLHTPSSLQPSSTVHTLYVSVQSKELVMNCHCLAVSVEKLLTQLNLAQYPTRSNVI